MSYSYIHITAYFYAPDAADESVLGVCSSSDDGMLITGDTQGYVYVWQIDDYAMRAHSKVSTLCLYLYPVTGSLKQIMKGWG